MGANILNDEVTGRLIRGLMAACGYQPLFSATGATISTDVGSIAVQGRIFHGVCLARIQQCRWYGFTPCVRVHQDRIAGKVHHGQQSVCGRARGSTLRILGVLQAGCPAGPNPGSEGRRDHRADRACSRNPPVPPRMPPALPPQLTAWPSGLRRAGLPCPLAQSALNAKPLPQFQLCSRLDCKSTCRPRAEGRLTCWTHRNA